eukprot:symbB.v1.2.035832.t1/scaffold4912.1/size32973/3
MARATATRRPRPGVLSCAALCAVGIQCFVGVRPGLNQDAYRTPRRAADQEYDNLAEFWIQDVSPRGRKVIEVSSSDFEVLGSRFCQARTRGVSEASELEGRCTTR